MATREKKLSLNRKQNTNSSVPKEIVTPDKQLPVVETVPKTGAASKNATLKGTSLAKKLAKKNPPKKLVKKPTIGIKLKAKGKKNIKINQKLAKSLLQNAKTLETKKLMKNGVKEVKPRRRRKPGVAKKNKDAAPVLEPIFPAEDNVEKKQPKKRLTKKALKLAEIESKKIKFENDDTLSIASDVTDISNSDVVKQRKARVLKKPKVEPETVDDVFNDLSFLIKSEDIKKEMDTMSESSKSDSVKVKKTTKKQKLDLLKKKVFKIENIENTLNKFDPSHQKIIDMLDLNVTKIKKESPIRKRRHSIEKFPITSIDCPDESVQLSVFNQLPRSISPRSKRATRVRQSIEGLRPRRGSPYTTRSDSPARILRNGKHRKLKDLNLLDGLDTDIKRRKRLCSDLSGSEMSVSKFSGYESDSSFSDLASLHGAEHPDAKDVESVARSVCQEANEKNIETDQTDDKIFVPSTIKRSLSSETAENGPLECNDVVDTNSNVCNHVNPVDINLNDKKQVNEPVKIDSEFLEHIEVSPSIKVPEKSIILDIMKQTFNEVVDDSEKRKSVAILDIKQVETVETSTFYGKTSEEELPVQELEQEIVEESPVIDETIVTEPALHLDVAVEEVKSTEIIAVAEPESIEIDLESPLIAPAITEDHQDLILENEIVLEQEEKLLNEPLDEVSIIDEPHTSEIVAEELNEENEPMEIENEPQQNAGVIETIEAEKTLESSNDSSISCSSKTPLAENKVDVDEGPEDLALKENILQALGLQSLKAAEEAKQRSKEKIAPRTDSYTGTLKTVIKINRDKKKGRNSLKMTLQKSKGKMGETEIGGNEEGYKIMKDGASTSWKHGNHSSDTAGAHRKSHYSNRSNMDGSSEHTSDGEVGSQDGAAKLLVIPEKASSFSIHPGRLCKDECSYCFGKFGLFDTPCHIAQMKSIDRQNKILSTEKHLTRDSCLCDACYRHVDRKSNTPSYTNKSLKRNSLVAPGPRQNHCHVLGCSRVSTNILRRKWIIKMRKSICQVINIDLDNPGLHSIPICDEHYSALEHLMVCAMCKRRLARNHIHYLGPEANNLNSALNAEGIPLTLTDKPVVCKLCKCFATIILKDSDERPENSANFFLQYKKRLLHFNDIVPMDEAAAEEPIVVPTKEKLDKPEKEPVKKRKKPVKNSSNNETSATNSAASTNPSASNSDCQEPEKLDQNHVPSIETNNQSRPESPADYSIDYNTLIPAIAMECGSDTESKKEPPQKKSIVIKKLPRLESVKEAVEVSKTMKFKNDKSDIAVQRLGSNPSISVRQLFPGEEDLALQANIDFTNVKEKTPEGWEKCSSIIQYDMDTKRLWHELQKPYGNQSSFLRHLILLEKYFRNGDLVLSPSASHHSQNYSESVHNRLRAYDNIPTNAVFSHQVAAKAQKSSSGIITSAHIKMEPFTLTASTPRSTPITISQLNSPPLIQSSSVLQSSLKSKNLGAPPGLISLHPGTNRPVAPLVRVPQSQKIKFPITKHWRPNLIPIEPGKRQERKVGLVQVISGGKPFHITLEDYKKMCAIKRSFEMKQKRLQDSQKPILVTHNSVLKSIIPRKGLIISKTITSPKNDMLPEGMDSESILEKLDKQVEKLDSKIEKPLPVLPKIPKSLTVIPQTVARKPSRPSSPVLLITPKSSSNKS